MTSAKNLRQKIYKILEDKNFGQKSYKINPDILRARIKSYFQNLNIKILQNLSGQKS